jgi:hypothetical protein
MDEKKKYQKPQIKSEKIFEKTVLTCAKQTGDPDCTALPGSS